MILIDMSYHPTVGDLVTNRISIGLVLSNRELSRYGHPWTILWAGKEPTYTRILPREHGLEGYYIIRFTEMV